MPTKVLIVDDHRGIRTGVRVLLGHQPELEVVDEAANGAEAVALAAEKKPDVVIMDIAMPKLDGCAATQRILSQDPHAKVLLLSSENWVSIMPVIKAVGAVGFVGKMNIMRDLPRAIERILRGETYFPPGTSV